MKRYLGVYFLVSAISVVSFWVFESRIDAAGYTLIVLWFIHPLILIGISSEQLFMERVSLGNYMFWLCVHASELSYFRSCKYDLLR